MEARIQDVFSSAFVEELRSIVAWADMMRAGDPPQEVLSEEEYNTVKWVLDGIDSVW